MNKKLVPYISWIVIVWFVVIAVVMTTKDTEAPTENLVNSGNLSTWTVTKIDEKNTWNESTDVGNISLWKKYAEWKIWSIKCEMKTEQEWWVINQTVYISWKKVRMDSNVLNEAWSNESFVINDWEYTYVWWTTWPAIKMKNEEVSSENQVNVEDTPSEENQEMDISKNLEQIPYNKCSEWKNDDSMFTVPVWVEFMDMDQYKNNMMKKTAEWKGVSVDEMEKMIQDFRGDK